MNENDAGDIIKTPADEKSSRSSFEGQLQFATVQELSKASAKLSKIESDVAQMKGWMMGTVSENGQWRPGVLATVGLVRGVHIWVISLLGLIATTLVTQLLIQVVHTFMPRFLPGGNS